MTPMGIIFYIELLGKKNSGGFIFCVFHIDIINDKLWVQEDATDYDLVGVLEEHGIPKNDIVLAFHAPYKRPFTGYAVA